MAGCNALRTGQEPDESETTTASTTTPTQTTAPPTSTTTAASSATETASRGSSSSQPIPAVAGKIPIPTDPAKFSFDYYDMLQMRQLESSGTLPNPTNENGTYPGAGGFEIPFTKIDTLLAADVDVVTGSFESESIITTLQQRSDAVRQEVYNGYEIYVERDRGSANAFSGETLISALFPDPSLSALKDTIDVLSGDGDRFYDVNTDFRVLVNALIPSIQLSGRLSPDSETADVRDDVGKGITLRAYEGTVTISVVAVFEDTAAATAAIDTNAVRESVMGTAESQRYFTTPEDVSVEHDGRIVTVSEELTPTT